MPDASWIIFVHFLAIWASVATGLIAGWLLPLPVWVSMPLGFLLWVGGLLYNISSINRQRREPATHRAAEDHRIYQRISARTLMNLGIALAFRSWLTIIVAIVLIPLYTAAARRRRRYIDYLRTGMLSDAFPQDSAKRRQP